MKAFRIGLFALAALALTATNPVLAQDKQTFSPLPPRELSKRFNAILQKTFADGIPWNVWQDPDYPEVPREISMSRMNTFNGPLDTKSEMIRIDSLGLKYYYTES
jgi:hypothetical protein